MTRTLVAALAAFSVVSPSTVFAQDAGQSPGDALHLASLQRRALTMDPRARELALEDEQAKLRLRNIEVEKLPTVAAAGLSQYQSDVPRVPFTLPGGQTLFAPSKETDDLSVRVDEHLFDPTRKPREALAESDRSMFQARLGTTLFSVRAEVNEAFFAAALLQQQIQALGATLDDLAARSREIAARVREGAALASDGDIVEAAVLEYRQQDAELRASRSAALARLASLTGQAIPSDAELPLPELADAVARARNGLDQQRTRPEYEQFGRTREQLARQADLATAAERPQLSAFGRAGYGRPGLNFVANEFESYAVAGVQVQWKGWTWGSASREREALGLQQAMVSSDEASFTETLHRSADTALSTIDRLASTLALDDRILALRESVDNVTRIRLGESVVTASDYLDRHTELLTAQFAQARHRVELAQARAGLLTMLGLEVR